LNKSQCIAVMMAVVFLTVLGALGIWHISLVNQRLLLLQERELDADRIKPQRLQPVASEPESEPVVQAPRTSDFADVSPDSYLTRAMFTAMLAKTDGADLSFSGCDAPHFIDVQRDEWYSAAVEWALHMGIVHGIGGGMFAPDEPISREQIAVMLRNYLGYRGVSVFAGETANISDRSSISGWALESVDAMRATGIVPDRPGDKFFPKLRVTNAEADAIFARLLIFLQERPDYPGNLDLDDYGSWLPQYEHPESSPLTVYRDEAIIIPKE
jgi:hypothetical protein